MYTECPVCFRTLTVTSKQLHIENSTISCPYCSTSFNTLQHLCANLPPELKDDPQITGKTRSHTFPAWIWSLGSILILLVLLFQIIYFNQQSWLNDPTIRNLVNVPCKLIDCHLPSFKQLKKLKIIKSSLLPITSKRYLLKIRLKNQARLAQSPPSIKLSLIDYKGEMIAERIFGADEYKLLPDNPEIKTQLIYTAELSLWIPNPKIGGHRIKFLNTI